MNIFLSWLIQLKAGVIDTFLKLKGFMNFGKMYATNNRVKEIKKKASFIILKSSLHLLFSQSVGIGALAPHKMRLKPHFQTSSVNYL